MVAVAFALGMSMVACSNDVTLSELMQPAATDDQSHTHSQQTTSSQPTTQTTRTTQADQTDTHSQQTTSSQPTTQTTNDDQSHDHLEEVSGTYLGDYEISDSVFGTNTTVTVSNDVRTITTNALPDHETGVFPNSGNPNTISAQSATYRYTTDPVYTGIAQEAHVPGVAVNGVKFEPGTAESVSCATGETYRVEGLQETFDLGMDFNNAHVQPTGAYHYHGLSHLLAETHRDSTRGLVHVGFAADGHLMYISTTADYTSSYRLSTTLRAGTSCQVSLGPGRGPDIAVGGTIPDGTYTSDWEYVEGSGDLDECNGISISGAYVYVITDEFPYISRCLKGEFTEIRQMGPGEGGPQVGDSANGGQNGPQNGQPNLAIAAAQLGVTEDDLRAALGPPPPNLTSAASDLGVSVQALQNALDASRQ